MKCGLSLECCFSWRTVSLEGHLNLDNGLSLEGCVSALINYLLPKYD